jgi:hypothetical protein
MEEEYGPTTFELTFGSGPVVSILSVVALLSVPVWITGPIVQPAARWTVSLSALPFAAGSLVMRIRMGVAIHLLPEPGLRDPRFLEFASRDALRVFDIGLLLSLGMVAVSLFVAAMRNRNHTP